MLSRNKGFEIIKVDRNNIASYINPDVRLRIEEALKNKTGLVYPSTISQLFRLALLAQNGGVFLGPGVMVERDLGWIWEIGRAPSHFVFSRFETLPKVLMFTHPFRGNSDQWLILPGTNSKSFDHAGFLNDVIAA